MSARLRMDSVEMEEFSPVLVLFSWGAQESKRTDRMLCCLHGTRDGNF